MSRSSPNLPNSTNASDTSTPKPGVRNEHVVKTFAFDATAGRSARAEDADLPVQTVPKPKYLAQHPLADLLRRASSLYPTAETQAEGRDDEYAILPVASELVDEQENAWRISCEAEPRWRRPRRKSAWWVVSLGLHVAIVIGLGFSTWGVVRQQEDLDLYSSAFLPVELEELQDLEIEPAEDFGAEFGDVELASFEELSGDLLLEEVVLDEPDVVADLPTQAVGSFAELDQLFGADGIGMVGLETGAGGATVSFFGTEVQAKRILFMLDNSGGMRHGGKFEALVSELRKSVRALEAKQEFYVIFYSDTVYPLYYPDSSRNFVRATDKNRRQLDRWLESVEFCVGNAIDEAFAATEVIRPDVVFLLTDGNLFTTEKKKAMLLDRGERQYPIYTFGMGVSKNSKTAAGLLQVAEINGGDFQAIEVSDTDRVLANQKQRPYHNKQPGAVWGKKVGARKW